MLNLIESAISYSNNEKDSFYFIEQMVSCPVEAIIPCIYVKYNSPVLLLFFLGTEGMQGNVGAKGPQGDKGPAGDPGQRGKSIPGDRGMDGPPGLAGGFGKFGDPGAIGKIGMSAKSFFPLNIYSLLS